MRKGFRTSAGHLAPDVRGSPDRRPEVMLSGTFELGRAALCKHCRMDTVVKLEVPWLPDAGDPDPHLSAGETGPTMVAYRAAVIAPTDEEFAVLRFPACQIVKLGYPNDEALPGHPLYPKGLSYYGLFEVLDSSWVKALAEQNLVVFPNATSSGRSSRHFVVTFHGSTLECIAERMEGRFASSLKDAMQGNAIFTSA
jgi:hypothetical protein